MNGGEMMEHKKPSWLTITYGILGVSLGVAFSAIIGYLSVRFSHTALLPTIAGMLVGLLLGAPILISLLRGNTTFHRLQKHIILLRLSRWLMLIGLLIMLWAFPMSLFHQHHPDLALRNLYFWMAWMLCYGGLITVYMFRARVVIVKSPDSSLPNDDKLSQ